MKSLILYKTFFRKHIIHIAYTRYYCNAFGHGKNVDSKKNFINLVKKPAIGYFFLFGIDIYVLFVVVWYVCVCISTLRVATILNVHRKKHLFFFLLFNIYTHSNSNIPWYTLYTFLVYYAAFGICWRFICFIMCIQSGVYSVWVKASPCNIVFFFFHWQIRFFFSSYA